MLIVKTQDGWTLDIINNIEMGYTQALVNDMEKTHFQWMPGETLQRKEIYTKAYNRFPQRPDTKLQEALRVIYYVFLMKKEGLRIPFYNKDSSEEEVE